MPGSGPYWLSTSVCRAREDLSSIEVGLRGDDCPLRESAQVPTDGALNVDARASPARLARPPLPL
jgi:hypothetical protein